MGSRRKGAAPIIIADKAELGSCRDLLAQRLAMYRVEKSTFLSHQIKALRDAIKAYEA